MRHAIIIVTAAKRDAANAETMRGTFGVPLVPASDLNAAPSHYMCGWWLTNAAFAKLAARFNSPATGRRMFDSQNWPITDALLTRLGLARQPTGE